MQKDHSMHFLIFIAFITDFSYIKNYVEEEIVNNVNNNKWSYFLKNFYELFVLKVEDFLFLYRKTGVIFNVAFQRADVHFEEGKLLNYFFKLL